MLLTARGTRVLKLDGIGVAGTSDNGIGVDNSGQGNGNRSTRVNLVVRVHVVGEVNRGDGGVRLVAAVQGIVLILEIRQDVAVVIGTIASISRKLGVANHDLGNRNVLQAVSSGIDKLQYAGAVVVASVVRNRGGKGIGDGVANTSIRLGRRVNGGTVNFGNLFVDDGGLVGLKGHGAQLRGRGGVVRGSLIVRVNELGSKQHRDGLRLDLILVGIGRSLSGVLQEPEALLALVLIARIFSALEIRLIVIGRRGGQSLLGKQSSKLTKSRAAALPLVLGALNGSVITIGFFSVPFTVPL